MEESLFTCEDCYQIIDNYKNANVIYKINQNGVLVGPKIIHRDIHEGKNIDYKWFKLDKINNNIFHIFIEYDIYKNNQSKIPLNFLDNWLNFVSEINNKYYQTNGDSNIYISYKEIKDISEDEKNGYFLSELIKLIDKIDEKYGVNINNSIIYDGIYLINGNNKVKLGKHQKRLCEYSFIKNKNTRLMNINDLLNYVYGDNEKHEGREKSLSNLIIQVNKKIKTIGLKKIFYVKSGTVINDYFSI